MSQYLLGYDLGSSSIKASLVEVSTGLTVASAQSPNEEMPMMAVQPGWAEQDPEMWWEHVQKSTHACLKKANVNGLDVQAIGISYQMHGLVCVDKDQQVLRPSIIWCDSRAVSIGNEAFKLLGEQFCLERLLNSPGNFTGSKLRWVKQNEPHVFAKVDKMMLPGDYLAMKLSGDVVTTASGLSEGVLWDYSQESPAEKLLDHYGISKGQLPTIAPTFGIQGKLATSAATLLGLKAGTPISYRAGDQPNNAFSLNVLNPGETAATAGTSGVIYSVTDKNAFDQKSRVNTFVHVNNKSVGTSNSIRNGVLLCINGTGIQNSWLRKNSTGAGAAYDYDKINSIAATAPIGSDGLVVLPFGNGAERVLENRNIDGSFHGLNFNRHGQPHLFRAVQEGIVFALKYGFDVLQEMGLKTNVIRAGNANMFLSPLFREAFVNTIGAQLELYDTDGAKGAALGAGVGAGIYQSFEEAFKGLKKIRTEEVDASKAEQYQSAYNTWLNQLNKQL
ncbi:xylulokinase [Pseudochryseolinea flava]|uniref:Carbohydrate kinase n=1 Tax=Pseudochryseolinea flava TaxID=2059302 RepID=A0A364Y0C4_9BACT|nr:FGGY family carbohydrate kinase [Pseudochryseolinea flava]RAW00244.1 carbohydrate kinase [Pseudochryseolinea flava]